MIVTDISRRIDDNSRINLAAYCRVSTDSAEQKHSFIAQVKYYRDYEKNDPRYKLVGVYADEGITGTSMSKRDGFNRMLQDCRDGKIDRIVVKSVSRFARNNEECLKTLRELEEIGVTVFFEKENIDTKSMNSEFIVSLFGMTAQQESMNISDNMRWSYQQRMQSGEFNTCKPALGYDLIDGKLVINEEEAVIVRRIFDMFLSGMGKARIAKILNEEEVGKKFGAEKWHIFSVHYILTNERYMGDALLQKRYTTTTLPFKEKVNHGEREQFYVKNSNEAIVSKETFNAVQSLMAKRKERKSIQVGEKHLLNRVVYCAQCGNPLRRIANASQVKWVCRGYSTNKTDCSAHSVYEKDLYSAFVVLANKVKTNRAELVGTTIAMMEQLAKIAGGNKEQIHEIDVELADLSKGKYRISQLYEKKILSDKDYIEKTNELEGRIGKLRADRRKLLAEDKQTEYLDELNELDKAVQRYENQQIFDPELFENIVHKIVVEDNGDLSFHLLGGLQFKERIR